MRWNIKNTDNGNEDEKTQKILQTNIYCLLIVGFLYSSLLSLISFDLSSLALFSCPLTLARNKTHLPYVYINRLCSQSPLINAIKSRSSPKNSSTLVNACSLNNPDFVGRYPSAIASTMDA